MRGVSAVLGLLHPWGACVWGTWVWGACPAGPLDVITQPVKLLSGPKISCSGKSQSGTFLSSFEFSHSIFCIFPQKKRAYRDFMCVLANKFSYSCPSVLSIVSVPKSDPFGKSFHKSLSFNMRKNSV